MQTDKSGLAGWLAFVYNPGLAWSPPSAKQTSVPRHTTRARTHASLSSQEQRRPCHACASIHMGELASTAAASLSSASSLLAAAAVKGDEERYVKVASRFFRVKPGAGGAVGRAARRHHFLDSCFLCKTSISRDRDIFMYKGDAAFCGEECRQEQMAMDEALHAAARRHRKQAAAETVRREAAGATAGAMVHRRPTIANLGAVARTPVVAS